MGEAKDRREREARELEWAQKARECEGLLNACQDCGCEGAETVECPFMAEVHGKIVEVTVCSGWLKERACDV